MSSTMHKHKHSVFSRFLSKSCFGCTSSSKSYALVDEEEELPAITEKHLYHDAPPPQTFAHSYQPSIASLPPPMSLVSSQSSTSPPHQPSTIYRRAILSHSNYHAPELPASDAHFDFSSRRIAKDTASANIDPVDNLSLMDTANMIGVASGLVGVGYSAATYHQGKNAERETRRRFEDLELGLRGEGDVVDAGVGGGSTEAVNARRGGERGSERAGGIAGQVKPLPGDESVWTGMK